jgi:malate synthase
MDGPNQLAKIPAHVPSRDAMLDLHQGPRTEAGARENIRVGVQYLAAWLGGKGAVPLYNLMEDAATAEICRTQLWQWLKFEAPFDDGRKLTPNLFESWFDEEVGLLAEVPNIAEAARLLHNMIVADDLVEFLTLPAYELLD